MKNNYTGMFLLSLKEYLKNEENIENGEFTWWLRDGSDTEKYQAYVGTNGFLNSSGEYIQSLHGIRPAIYINPAIIYGIPKAEDDSIIIGDYKEEPLKWDIINEEEGLCLCRNVLEYHIFDEESNKYWKSSVKKLLKRMFFEIFSNDERAFVLYN